MTWPDRPRMLLSFAYHKELKPDALAALPGVDLIIDSGAFTAMSSGKPIVHADYIAFLEQHQHLMRLAFSLDVIGDPEASYANFQRERAALGDKVQIVPAYHLGSDWHHLERLCQLTDYVAIGGAVPHARRPKIIMQHTIRAHQIAAKHGTRLHGLGITGRDAITKLPWASVDSTAWKTAARYPTLYLSTRQGELRGFTFGDKVLPRDRDMIRAYGELPDNVATPSWATSRVVGKELATQRWRKAVTMSARAYMNVEAAINQRRRSADFRLYLAAHWHADWPRIQPAWAAGTPFPPLGEAGGAE